MSFEATLSALPLANILLGRVPRAKLDAAELSRLAKCLLRAIGASDAIVNADDTVAYLVEAIDVALENGIVRASQHRCCRQRINAAPA